MVELRIKLEQLKRDVSPGARNVMATGVYVGGMRQGLEVGIDVTHDEPKLIFWAEHKHLRRYFVLPAHSLIQIFGEAVVDDVLNGMMGDDQDGDA